MIQKLTNEPVMPIFFCTTSPGRSAGRESSLRCRWRDAERRSGPRGFTITELLVVIAIVGVLASLILAMLAPIRRASLVTRDLGQLRALGVASMNYATDHRGALVDARLPHGSTPMDESESFATTLKPYVDDRLALKSPLDESPHWYSDGAGTPVGGSGTRYRVTSYGLNNHLCREFSAWGAIDPNRVTDRLSMVPAPAATVHFLHMAPTGPYAGADHVHVEEWGGPAQAPTVSATQCATSIAGGAAGTGAARSNWAFADGHVETTGFSSLYLDIFLNRFDPLEAATYSLRLAGVPGEP